MKKILGGRRYAIYAHYRWVHFVKIDFGFKMDGKEESVKVNPDTKILLGYINPPGWLEQSDINKIKKFVNSKITRHIWGNWEFVDISVTEY